MKLHLTMHKDQRYLVVGLGLTGYSVASYLLQHSYKCTVQDDREQPPYLAKLRQNYPSVKVLTEDLTESLLADIDCLIVSPGLSVRSPLMRSIAKSGKRIIGDIELFAEAVDKPVLAITGSNGKSTVTSLLGEMIEADGKTAGVGGNIGVPALDLLGKNVDFYVLELSSFQLETTSSLRPVVSTVLNISEDHMDRYNDLDDYRQSKKSIYQNSSICVSNKDDVLTQHKQNDIQFSLTDLSAQYSLIESDKSAGSGFEPHSDPERVKYRDVLHYEPMLTVNREGWIRTSELKLKGRHNWANCLAAMAMADQINISKSAILKVLRSYAGLPHRSQWVAEINGVSWINDSKATNPGATKAAVEGFDEPVILLAGGQSKGADVSVLCESLKQHVKTVLLFGQDADLIEQSWQHCVDIQRVENMQSAVQLAREEALAGDIVLLSPACASFDMYSGFAARGDHFCSLVRAMS